LQPRRSEGKWGEKENEEPIEDLEFPPGLPRPIHLCPPPGIRPRPQRQLAKPVSQYTPKAPQTDTRKIDYQFNGPNIQVLGRSDNRKRRRNERPEDLFDPMNPENPFFMQHPKRQAMLRKEVKKREREEQKAARKAPAVPAPGKLEYGPSRPSANDATSDLPALPDPTNPSGGKLEILLPDSMLSLRPTAVKFKRQRIETKKHKHAPLELAPEVGLTKPNRNRESKTQNQTEYDQFLQEIESLM